MYITVKSLPLTPIPLSPNLLLQRYLMFLIYASRDIIINTNTRKYVHVLMCACEIFFPQILIVFILWNNVEIITITILRISSFLYLLSTLLYVNHHLFNQPLINRHLSHFLSFATTYNKEFYKQVILQQI